MDNLEMNEYLSIVNDEKDKKGLNNFISLYPMFRTINNKLYVTILLINDNDNIWDIKNIVKPSYWILLDIKSKEIIEFNKTTEKDYVLGSIIPKSNNNMQQEISKYVVEKKQQYKNYLIEDIKNNEIPIQKKLSTMLNNEVEVDKEKVDISEYLIANLDENITKKINELVDLLVESKYNSLTIYYCNLFNQIVKEYIENNNINKEKIRLCIEIMNNYYDALNDINNLFNI